MTLLAGWVVLGGPADGWVFVCFISLRVQATSEGPSAERLVFLFAAIILHCIVTQHKRNHKHSSESAAAEDFSANTSSQLYKGETVPCLAILMVFFG